MGIEVNVNLMILVFGCFLILIVYLNKWLYKPLIQHMADRDAKISKDMQNTKDNAKEVVEIQNKIDAIIASAQQEAKTIIEQATAVEKEKSERLIAEKKVQLEEQFKQFRQQLSVEESNLRSELARYSNEYKIKIQEKLSGV